MNQKIFKIFFISNNKLKEKEITSFFCGLLTDKEIIQIAIDKNISSYEIYEIKIKLKPKDFLELISLARKKFQKNPEVITALEHAYMLS